MAIGGKSIAGHQALAGFVASEAVGQLIDAIRDLNLGSGLYELLHPNEERFDSALRATFNLAEGQSSPIILDLDGDGIVETTSRDAGGTRLYFDLDNSGYAERSGWVGKDDGLLVRDLNADGRIDSGAELFGNHTLLADGTRAVNGFQALVELDTNRDGVINASDAQAFASLCIWKDADGDGQTDAGELLTMEEAGVRALNVVYSDHGTQTPLDLQGNQHRQKGSYVAADGSTRGMNDVWFSIQPGETVDLNPVEVRADITELPNLAGMGNVPSLHQAMARDTSRTLKGLVEQWIAADSQARDGLLDQIIYHWTGVQDVAPGSRGYNIGDPRQLAALEAVLGEPYHQGGWGANPGPQASAILATAFLQLKNHALTHLLIQTDFRPMFDSIGLVWDDDNGEFSVDVSEMIERLRSVYEADNQQGLQAILLIGEQLTGGDAFAEQVLKALQVAGQNEIGRFGLFLQYAGYSVVEGTASTDVLHTPQGTATGVALLGLGGNDMLTGGAKDDMLIGGEGNDTLNGGWGNDTYIFNLGDGQDTITDVDYTGVNTDTLQLEAGLTPANTEVVRNGNDLVLRWAGNDSDSMTIKGVFFGAQVNSTCLIESVKFADGTTWSTADVMARLVQDGAAGNDTLIGLGDFANRLRGLGGNDMLTGGAKDDVLDGGDGNDILSGNAGADTLIGGKGNDTLIDGWGNDTYIFNLGDGADTITDYDHLSGNHDVLRLGAGLAAANIEVIRFGSDLVLRWTGNASDSVTIKNQFADSQIRTSQLIESVVFDEGTIWTLDDFMARLVQYGSAGDDLLQGLSVYANRMKGLQGNDTLYGGAEDDVLEGGAGDDALFGGGGTDTLTGGQGTDELAGGLGNDTYHFNLGDGADTITDVDMSTGNQDTLRLGAGLLMADIEFVRTGNDLMLRWAANTHDSVTIKSLFYGPTGQASGLIELVTFADGTTSTLGDLVERLVQDGSSGNDILYGANDFANHMTGWAGNDTLIGGIRADTLIGGAGSDTLNGGAGSDIYQFNKGDGADTITDFDAEVGNRDTLRFGAGLLLTETEVVRNGNDLILRWVGNDSDSVTIKSLFSTSQIQSSYMIESVEFADGAKLALNDLLMHLKVVATDGSDTLFALNDHSTHLSGLAGDDTLTGSAKADLLEGGDGNDTLYGGHGDDILIGGRGNDVLDGGSGIDTYVFHKGDGSEVIKSSNKTGGINQDVLQLGAGLAPSTTLLVRGVGLENLHLTLVFGNGDQVKLENYFVESHRVKTILFADGTQWEYPTVASRLVQYGTPSNDTLFGDAQGNAIDAGAGDDLVLGQGGDDILIGGTGNDSLIGGDGDDRYLFNLGDGRDTIVDGSGDNRLVFGTGIGADQFNASQSGPMVTLTVAPGDAITFFHSVGGYSIRHFEFADGSVLGIDWITTLLNPAPAAPVTHSGTDKTLTLQEDMAITLAVADLGFVGATAGDSLGAVRIDSLPLVGSLRLNGINVNAGEIIGATDLAAGRLVFTPVANAHGTAHASFTFSVAGQNGAFDLTPNVLTFNVTPVNDAPLLTSAQPALAVGAEDTTYTITQASLLAGFSDVDGDALSVTGLSANNGSLSAFDALTQSWTFTPDANHNGSIQLSYSVSDGTISTSATHSFTLVARNDAPTVSVPLQAQTATEDAVWTYTVPASTFTDADAGDTLSYSASLTDGNALPAWLSFDAATRTFSGTPGNAQIGALQLKVTATDAAGATASGDFTVNVVNVNDAPTVSAPLQAQSATEDTAWSYSVPAGTFADVDAGDTLSYSASLSNGDTLPAWLSFNAATRTFSGTPGNAQVGAVELKVTATDAAGAAASSSFTVNVVNVNDTPTVVAGLPTQAATEGVAWSYTVPTGTFADVDVDAGDVLTYSATRDDGSALPVWLSFNAATRTLAGTPPIVGGSQLAVRILATDLAGASASSVLTLNATAGDAAMRYSSTSASLGANERHLTLTGNAAISAYGNTLDNQLVGNSAANTLNGGDGNDVLTGGAGNDTLRGDRGNDTYVFNQGEGADIIEDFDITAGNQDTLRLGAGLTASNLQVVGNSNGNIVLSWADSPGDSVTVQLGINGNGRGIEAMTFADGTTWGMSDLYTRMTIQGSAGNDNLSGLSAYANRMYGFDGNDNLYGGTLADHLEGGKGNDRLSGGAGNDNYVFNQGDGADIIEDFDTTTGNQDTLRLGAGLTASNLQVVGNSNGNMVLSWADTPGDSVTVQLGINGNGRGIEAMAFADGTTWGMSDLYTRMTIQGSAGNDNLSGPSAYANRMYGLDGNDTLYGGNLADHLEGGKGNDSLQGGKGNDTYVFNQGDGADTIDDYDATVGNQDTLRLGAGLTAAGTQVVGNRNGDLVLSWTDSPGDSVTMRYATSSSGAIETVAFADGMTWGASDLYTRMTIQGSAGSDYLSGLSAYANRMYGLDGNDTLYGGTLADHLEGGKGNDSLQGGKGNDTYVFNQGDGADTIDDYDAAAGNQDTLRFDAGIAHDQLWFNRVGNDLKVSVLGSTEGVSIRNWYHGAGYQIEQIKTSDNQTLLHTQVDALVQAMAAFAPPAAGQSTLPANYQSALAPVIAASWN